MTSASSARIQHFLTNPDIFVNNKQMAAEKKADEHVPPITHCQYCGAELLTWAFGWQGVYVWRPEPERCVCQKAALHWAEIDRELAHRKQALLKQMKEEQERAEINRLMSESGLADRYPDYRLEKWTSDTELREKAIKNARWYLANFQTLKAKGGGLYIAGDSERGKTHLAAGIAYELVQQKIPVIMTSMSDLLSRIRASYNDGAESEQRLMFIMSTVDLLIIDDLGKERPTEWALEKMFAIIDARINKKLPIIITTNYTDEELFKRLAAEESYGNYKNDPKTAKAIIARLHRGCINMNASWQRWEGKAG